jgi:hypothetical protein
MGKKLTFWTAGLCALAVALATLPAEAQQQKKKGVTTKQQTVVTTRSRTRVVVRSRSYLDAGTELLPGERKFTDYAFPPTYSPTAPVENTTFWRRPYPTATGIWPGNW